MENLEIYNKVKEVPESAKRKILGGKLKGFTDINPMLRIKKLTEVFGPCGVGWYTQTTRKWLEQKGEEIAAFCDINLYICVNGEWSMPIEGTGGSSFVASTKNGLDMSDECFKMAYTDALSVACKSLGVAADVYWEGDRTKYTRSEELAEKNNSKSKAEPKPKPEPMPAPTKEQIDKMLKDATDEASKCLKVSELYAVWDKYEALHNVKEFKDTLSKMRTVCEDDTAS